MPNWCNNTLHVDGDLNELADFKSKVLVPSNHDKDRLDFTMEVLYPTPKELLEVTSPVIWRGDDNDIEGKRIFEEKAKAIREKYGFDDWYDWRVSNWGTKWDVSDSWVDEHNGDALSIEYNTAWGPNTAFIIYASSKYPNLNFRLLFEEPGCDFCGELICEDGEVQIFNESELVSKDEYGNAVEYDAEKSRWYVVETNEVIDDEDFYPALSNPFV
jgi:hypothetical protein